MLMPHRILPPKGPVEHVKRETRAAFLFGDLISPDTGLDLYLGLGLLLSIWYIHHSFSAAFRQRLGSQLLLVLFRWAKR